MANVLFADYFSTTLLGPLTSSSTSMTLTSVAGLPAVGGGLYCYITLIDQVSALNNINPPNQREIVQVTAVSGNICTIIRGIPNTSPSAWNAGDVAQIRVNAQGLADLGGATPGNVTSVSCDDATLTISPTTGNVKAALNLGHANTWTVKQTFRANATGAGTAPIYLQDGTLMTTPENGAIEFSSGLIYFTPSFSIRQRLAYYGDITFTNITGIATAAQTPAFTGDVTKPSGSAVMTLANTGVVVGAYTNANIAVDAKGRILVATSGSGGTGGTITPGTTGQLTIYPANGDTVQGVTLLPATNFPILTGDVTTSGGSLATTLADTTVTPGSYTNADITVDSSGRLIAASSGTASGLIATCNGRLTGVSGAPVNNDATAITTIYWTPYKGAQISLFDGVSVWTTLNFAETALPLGTLTAGKNYDVFGYNSSGTLALEFSSAWANNSDRTDALSLQDGIYVKDTAKTRRYLGTIYTSSTTTTEDYPGGGVSQVGGRRLIWNYYNRVARPMTVIDTTSTWVYITDTWRQANNAFGNRVGYCCGISEEYVTADLLHLVRLAINSANGARAAIGLDSTTAPQGLAARAYCASSDQSDFSMNVSYLQPSGRGYHELVWLERGADVFCVFLGNNNNGQAGMTAWIQG